MGFAIPKRRPSKKSAEGAKKSKPSAKSNRQTQARPPILTENPTTETRDPDGYADLIIELASNPLARISELMKKHGYSRAVVTALKNKLRTKQVGLKEELFKISNQGLQNLVEDRLVRTIDAIDDEAIADANLKDRAYAADRMFNMRQLLKGEPTAIVSNADRAKLNELLPLLMREAQRRGIIIDGQAVPVEEQRGIPDSRVDIVDAEVVPR